LCFVLIAILKLQEIFLLVYAYKKLKKSSWFEVIHFLFISFYIIFIIFYLITYEPVIWDGTSTAFVAAFSYTYLFDPKRFLFFFFSFVYMFVFILSAIKYGKKFFIRYLFAFLSAISVLLVYRYFDISDELHNINMEIMEVGFLKVLGYLMFIFLLAALDGGKQTVDYFYIPIIFLSIQLLIEAYYFYKKEKPIWIRFNRMKKYKNSIVK
jgi:hypothetical protein